MPNLTSVGTLSSLTVSGNLVADGSTFKIDSVNNRVGIGTATPIRPLHIKSEGSVFAIEGNTHSYIEFYPDSYSNGRKGYFGYPGSTNDGLYFINENNANIVFGTNSAERLIINGSGDVGIGTASPSTKLHVSGNITCTTLVGDCSGTTTSINITEDTSSNSKLIIPFTNNTSSTTGSRQLKSNSNLNINPSTLTLETPKNITIKGALASNNSDERPTTLKFDLPFTGDVKEGCFGSLIFKDILTGSANARPSLSVELSVINPSFTNTPLTIVSHSATDGRVGIGTTSPSTPLHVNGNITCTTLVGNCSGTSTSVNLTQDTSTNSSLFIPFTDGTSGSRQLKGSSSLTFNPSTGTLSATNLSGSLSTFSRTDNRIIIANELSSNKVQFNFSTFNNNNNSPYADAIHFNTWSDGSGGKQNLLMLNKSNIGMRIYQDTFGSSTAYSTYKDVVLADSNGNVGIGQTTPVEKLDVAGGIRIGNASNSNAGTIKYVDNIFYGHNGTDWIPLSNLSPVTKYLNGIFSIAYSSSHPFQNLTDSSYNTTVEITKTAAFNKLLVLVQVAVGYNQSNVFAGIRLNRQIDSNTATSIVNSDSINNTNNTFLDASMGNSTQVAATKQLHGNVLDNVSSVNNNSTIKYYLSAQIHHPASTSNRLYFGGPGNTGDTNRYNSPTVLTLIPYL